MSAGRTEGSCLTGCPLGIMLGVRSCKGECDLSHAVAGPAEESLGDRLTSVDLGWGLGVGSFIKASSVCEQATMC